MTTLPNMLIDLPTLGADNGAWDDKLNAGLTKVDAHDHTTNKGTRVPSAGININADLAFGGYGPTGLGKAAFNAVAALASGTKTLFVSSADNELYWRTNGGSNVKLTNGASLNITLVGGIAGDYSSVGAEVAYSDADKVYTFKQNGSPKPWARIASGPVRIHEHNTTETVYVELAVAAALASSYTITLPAALPAASLAVLQISTTGAVSYAASLTLANNQSFGVTGTGKYRHGNKTVMIPMLLFHAVGGTITGNGSNPGITADVGGTVFNYPLLGFTADKRIVSVQMFLDSAPTVAFTYTLCLSGFVFSTIGTTAHDVVSASSSPTLTPATPFSLAPADNGGYNVAPWIRFTCATQVSPIVFTHMLVTFDDV